MYERSGGVRCAHGEEALKYAPWSYLAHGWIARTVLIIDRTVADRTLPIVKGTRGSSGKSNHTILIGSRGCRITEYWYPSTTRRSFRILRGGLPYAGLNEGTYMRTCPAFETFPFEAEALQWESVAARTGIFEEGKGPRPIRVEKTSKGRQMGIGGYARIGQPRQGPFHPYEDRFPDRRVCNEKEPIRLQGRYRRCSGEECDGKPVDHRPDHENQQQQQHAAPREKRDSTRREYQPHWVLLMREHEVADQGSDDVPHTPTRVFSYAYMGGLNSGLHPASHQVRVMMKETIERRSQSNMTRTCSRMRSPRYGATFTRSYVRTRICTPSLNSRRAVVLSTSSDGRSRAWELVSSST